MLSTGNRQPIPIQKKTLRVYHATEYCHAGSSGGTERYILDLIKNLEVGYNIDNTILWIGKHRQQEAFVDSDITIHPLYTQASRVDVPEMCFTHAVTAVLDGRDKPDLIHFHTFGLNEAVIAKVACAQGIPYLFTYHSPAWSCRRGDLLRWGTEICDGEVRPWRCSVCMMQQRLKCPVPLAWMLTGVLAPLGLVGRFAGGNLHRRTAFIEDTARFRQALRTFLSNAAAVVACAEWSISVLARNGAPPDHIAHNPQGVSMDFVRTSELEKRPSKERATFNVGYAGRVTEVKGVHILVEAFANTVYPHAQLHIIGCNSTRAGNPYLQHLKKLAGDDPRIHFIGTLPFEAIIGAYQKLDVLAIPSLWLETGPLTLLEALSLGVGVWGSDTVGQMAVLKAHGRVIKPTSVVTWQAALESAFAQHASGALDCTRSPITVRTMREVASEIALVYRSLMASNNKPISD